MNIIEKIFKTKNPLIGMIHFPPLAGYKNYPGFEYIIKKTLDEIEILNESGFNSIMLENNYDIPHKAFVEPEITAMMAVLTQMTIENTKLPVGLDVLWNDYKTSLGICACTKAKYFRIPAFVDDVRTLYGDMHKVSEEAISYRKKLGLEEIAIFADVQVKHAEMIDKRKKLAESIEEAYLKGADAVIITGKWTGDAPKIDDLIIARKTAGERPILIGSGSTPENLDRLLDYADGIIVGTAIMTDKKVDEGKVINYFESFTNWKRNKTKDK